MTLPDPAFWRQRRVLVTGHTGFKGGWLALWLAHMGAEVTGYALPPEQPDGIFTAAQVGHRMTPVIGDVRERTKLRQCIALMRPEIVFHLAAQSLVRRAHADPLTTYAVNVSGTAEVLEAARAFPFIRTVVVATSDKVYENREGGRAFVESDRLGGLEPYGASKAAAEIVTAAFRENVGDDLPAVATVRAGNVIGGGDWAEDRLIPDAIRAFRRHEPLEVRNPASLRPWQFVLEPLCGYLLLAERLTQGDQCWRSAWNFGGDEAAAVSAVADRLAMEWNAIPALAAQAAWVGLPQPKAPYEAQILKLDSSKAKEQLGWRPRLSFAEALTWTTDWYVAQAQGAPLQQVSLAMIDRYMRG